VTCRDWFQLTLKEGLTVFRDQVLRSGPPWAHHCVCECSREGCRIVKLIHCVMQEFTATQTSRAVKRINDVAMLRAAQFSEDGGPMAHPIRPDSYLKMDNFYTLTVYEKGAEVVRIYQTLLGKAGFRKVAGRGAANSDGCVGDTCCMSSILSEC
jgi:aminopeptidase N